MGFADEDGGGDIMRTKIAELGSLTDGKPFCVKTPALNVLLIRQGTTVHAVENRCPHLNLPMARGKVVGGEIVCPFHGSRFDIRTGENTDWVSAVAGMRLPAWSSSLLSFGKKPQPIKTYSVSLEGQDIFIEA
jgi:nitrite reductase/ring-hydroxylating ferredoxin subunit